jgi:hypothetical protein
MLFTCYKMAFGVLPFYYIINQTLTLVPYLILQIDLRDKGALEMVFASTR